MSQCYVTDRMISYGAAIFETVNLVHHIYREKLTFDKDRLGQTA